jgi:hypothetical protein
MADFDLSLKRNQYAAGETAKGTLITSADKDFKTQGFKFSASLFKITPISLNDILARFAKSILKNFASGFN